MKYEPVRWSKYLVWYWTLDSPVIWLGLHTYANRLPSSLQFCKIRNKSMVLTYVSSLHINTSSFSHNLQRWGILNASGWSISNPTPIGLYVSTADNETHQQTRPECENLQSSLLLDRFLWRTSPKNTRSINIKWAGGNEYFSPPSHQLRFSKWWIENSSSRNKSNCTDFFHITHGKCIGQEVWMMEMSPFPTRS